MGLKQKTMKALIAQFHRPHGLGGRAAGWFMAHRGSNRKRNVWAAGLLVFCSPLRGRRDVEIQ